MLNKLVKAYRCFEAKEYQLHTTITIKYCPRACLNPGFQELYFNLICVDHEVVALVDCEIVRLVMVGSKVHLFVGPLHVFFDEPFLISL